MDFDTILPNPIMNVQFGVVLTHQLFYINHWLFDIQHYQTKRMDRTRIIMIFKIYHDRS